MNNVPTASAAAELRFPPSHSLRAPDFTELVYAIAGGDQKAFERFYDLTVSKISARAFRIVRCRATAEEVAEDVYVQIWQSADKFDADRSTPLGWAMTICNSRALDTLRRRDSAILDADPTERLDVIGDQSSTNLLDLLQTKQEKEAMQVAISKLQPEQRQIIGLAFFRGLTHQEISVASQTPIGTVKSRIRRALSTLRRELGAV
jgi:RNA polymerase sigma factor (sigma-70 family)